MQQWIPLICLALPLSAVTTASAYFQAGATATERAAKQTFEERYGQQVRRVMASKGVDDDVALAAELLTAARMAADRPLLLAELCDNAFVLGMRDAAGYDTALDAMTLEAATLPDRAAAAHEKVVTSLRRILATAKGEEHAAASRRLFAVLARQADERAAASDFGGAAKLYQQALRAAEDGKVTDLAGVKAKFDAAAAREKLELRIEAANEKIASDPANGPANAELFQIYLLELDNPAQAARYALHGANAAAKKLLPLVNAPAQGLTPAQCVEVAEWYEALIADTSPGGRAAMIRRSRAYYDQFVMMPGADKPQRVKALLAIGRLREAFVRTCPEEAKLLAPVNEEGWVDLLTGVEAARHRVSGKWRRGDAGMQVVALPEPARLLLAATARESYELSVRFTPTTGEGAVVIVLPVGERHVRLVLGGWAGKASGLYSLGDETVDAATGVRKNTSTVMPGELVNEQEYVLQIRTTIKGDEVNFGIDLNGERYIDWTGPRTQLTAEPAWSLREPGAFALGAENAGVRFSAVKLHSLRGDAMLLPRPATIAERGVIVPADGMVDLLELWDPAKDNVDGAWARELGSAVLGRGKDGNQPRTRMPVFPDGDYTLRTRFTCIENKHGGGGPILLLPVKDTFVALVTGTGKHGDLAGLAVLGGKGAPENDSTETGIAFEEGKQHLLEIHVSIADDKARIESELDGKKLVRWEGARSLLTPPPKWLLGDGRSPGVAMHMADFTFETVELRMDKGSARLLRQPPQKMVTDTTPVDLLGAVDGRRHALGGTWSVEAGKLTGNAVGKDVAALMLPVIPQGNYEMRIKFARSGGRPIVNVYLPVAGAGVELTMGANDGRTGSLSAPATKAGDNNIVVNSNVRLVNSTAYALRIKVESAGADVNIQVELDGKPYLNWKGAASLLKSSSTMPNGFNLRAPGLVVTNPVIRSSATFAEVELRMITGAPKKLE